MSRRRKNKSYENSLTDLAAGVANFSQTTGGSSLASYGTIAFNNNYSLLTLNRIILTYLYTGNGIFQTAIQLPIQDAISKGVEIESGELSGEDISELMKWFEENELWEKILDYFTWVRLFGGGALIINTNQDPETELDIKTIGNSPIEFYDVDRWQIDSGNAGFNNDTYQDVVDQEYYYLYGKKIHKSRVIRGRGKRAPSYVRRNLRGWGMSEGERMIQDLNLYLKTKNITYEILDESKIDVFKIKGLANKMLTTTGTTKITQRIQVANEIKNYINALVLDTEEEFDQKSMTFSGLAEIMNENRIGVAAALRMPLTKLFGLSASGFNTGESDLENYNAMVESEIRPRLNYAVKTLLEIGCMKVFGYIPSFSFKWPSLRVLTAKEEEEIKASKTNRLVMLYDRALLNSQEIMSEARQAGIITTETEAEQGLVDNFPTPPNGTDMIEPGGEF